MFACSGTDVIASDPMPSNISDGHVIEAASLHILLESVPEKIDTGQLGEALPVVPGVESYHNLYVWAITSSKVIQTAHAD